MRISTDQLKNCTILHLAGEFGTLDCPSFLGHIEKLVASGPRHVVVNLRLTKFINSTALGAILKASKAVRAKGGKLVISRPSPVCRDTITSMGLDRVIPVFENDDVAVHGLDEAEPAPEMGSAKLVGTEDSTVLFSPTDQDRLQQFVTKPARGTRTWHGVGHMAEIDAERLRFSWDGGNTDLGPDRMIEMLAVGSELRVKFRLPMLERGYHEAVVAVGEIQRESDGVRVVATYRQIDAETLQAVKQYAEDMSFLKSELTHATEDLGESDSPARE